MVCKYLYISQYSLLYFEGPDTPPPEEPQSSELLDELTIENAAIIEGLYETFLKGALGLNSIQDIYAALYFVHPLIEIESSTEAPVACAVLKKNHVQRHYEEFLSYQTHSSRSLEFVSNHLKSGY